VKHIDTPDSDVVGLTSPEAWDSLIASLSRGRTRVTVLAEVLAYARHVLCAQSAVVEDGYVDRDYRDEFSNIYSKCFRSYGDRAQRVHFFARELSGIGDIRDRDPDYLGFMVVRPVEVGVVGRTVLSPPDGRVGIRCYSLCSETFEAHIHGRCLAVTGAPFIEQDRMSMSCAQASIWMALRYLSQSSRTDHHYPYEISELATQHQSDMPRTVPASGLTMQAMVQGIKNNGYGALLEVKPRLEMKEQASRTETLAAYWLHRWDPNFRLYTYVESQVPVLAMFHGASHFHAMTVVGHSKRAEIVDADLAGVRSLCSHDRIIEDLASAAEDEETKEWCAQLRSMSANFLGAQDYVDAFVVHDDQHGPYRLLPTSVEARVALEGSPAKPYLTRGDYASVLESLRALVVPLPEKLYLEGQFAYQQWFSAFTSPSVFGYLKQLSEHHEMVKALVDAAEGGSLITRLLFTKSSAFKEWARDESRSVGLAENVRRHYLSTPMPTYVWVLELTTDEYFKGGRELILGEYVFDATANALDPEPFVAVHLPHVLVVHDREGAWPKDAVPQAVYEDEPHACYRRA